MHSSRIVRIAGDLVKEYQDLKVFELIDRAIHLAVHKSEMTDPQYAQRLKELRDAAHVVTNSTRFRLYPDDLQRFV